MSYDENSPMRNVEARASLDNAVRRARPDQDGSGVSARLDRLDKVLHATDDALAQLHEKLSPVLAPEAPSALEGMVSEEPRSELSARLDRMANQADSHLAYLRSLRHRVDL